MSPSYTPNYGLEELDGSSGDSFSLGGWKFTKSDRAVIDALLCLGAETHHHTGINRVANNPGAAPTLALSATGGTLQGGLTAYYEYTFVDPNGLESAPSPIGSVATPAQIATPGTPTGVFSNAAGTNTAGNYYFIISWYVGSSTVETLPSLACAIAAPSTGEFILTLPTPPAGVTGANIYKMAPGSVQYLFLASTAATTYTDNGSVAVNCNRTLPTGNSTGNTSSVVVTRISSLPSGGYTWNLYRTFTAGSWGATQIASGQTGSTFTDTGQTAASYTPPTQSQIPGTPPKIDLASEVQNRLPAANLQAPLVITFAFAGTLSVTTGSSVWTSPFTNATIVSARCSLGRGSAPASTPVIADVLISSNAATPTYSSIYSGATPNPKPQVPVGLQIGSPAPPNITSLGLGESLSVDIDQVGGGATPTDHDLTVTIYLLIQE
jgi:hypothetical protein